MVRMVADRTVGTCFVELKLPRLTSDEFVDRASELLRNRCGGDVSLSMVLGACGAQKGSLYHFFPNGKDELLTAAVLKMGNCAVAHIELCIEQGESAAAAIKKHLSYVARLMDRPDSPIGLPFVTLSATIGANNEGVRNAAEDAICRIESLYAAQLVLDGWTKREAKQLAEFAVFAIDGAIGLSHARGHSKPLKIAAAQLAAMFQRT